MLYRIKILDIGSMSADIPMNVTIHFKNPNGTYAMDPRLPHGHTQYYVFGGDLPFVVDFEFPSDEDFVIDDIITCITLSQPGKEEYGESRSRLVVVNNQITSIKSVCN